MNNVYDLSDACRACLRVESPLTSINAQDNDSIKLCDKLMACLSDIVSCKIRFFFDYVCLFLFRYG